MARNVVGRLAGREQRNWPKWLSGWIRREVQLQRINASTTASTPIDSIIPQGFAPPHVLTERCPDSGVRGAEKRDCGRSDSSGQVSYSCVVTNETPAFMERSR